MAPLMALVLVGQLARQQPSDHPGQAPADLADAAEEDFGRGDLQAAVDKYDRLAALVPEVAAVLWQRGIALYELGRYRDCAAQFAAFFAVDRTDLENATWYFLCQARATTPERARAAVLDAGPDPRVLRTQIYEMVQGRRTSADLMALADRSVGLVQFYAHVYIGYYLEATGHPEDALPHFVAAASEKYAGEGGFMNVVAHVHLSRLRAEAGVRAGR
jgi:lipoprotein NlpI